MLPYLLSERAPHWSSLPRGAYVGLTRAHRREHLVRAALEGVCQQLGARARLDARGGQRGARDPCHRRLRPQPLWRQMLADALGMPVGFPAGHEGSAFGAALLGMEALGLIEGIDRAAELVAIEDVVGPTRRGGGLRRPAAHVRLALRRADAGLPCSGAPPLSHALWRPRRVPPPKGTC